MNAETIDPPVAFEPLISVDSHVHFTDEWVKARLSTRLQALWDDAKANEEKYEATELRQGAKQLEMEDFVDLEAAMDPGHFEPIAKLAAMDRDRVQAEVIFPEVGGTKLCQPKWMGDDWKEALRGYNQSMIDFAAVDPDRLLAAYQISLFDIPYAVSEVHRVAAAGAKCIQLPSFPCEYGLPDVYDARYDPLWSAISETGLTVLNHIEIRKQYWDIFRRDPTPQRGIFTAAPATSMAEVIAFWILTGTLARFPKLKVILVEPGLGWIPWWMDFLDQRMKLHYEFPGLDMLPSEYFKAQMGITFMDEPMGLKACYDAFGPDNLYWSTDFPHPATCWPNSQRQVKSQFAKAGIPEADRRKIVYDNSIRTFGLKALVSA
jgi:predicted TIM-barrel fold metal-dependent hydrolase